MRRLQILEHVFGALFAESIAWRTYEMLFADLPTKFWSTSVKSTIKYGHDYLDLTVHSSGEITLMTS